MAAPGVATPGGLVPGVVFGYASGMKPVLVLFPLTILLAACESTELREVRAADRPALEAHEAGTTCPAGEECFAPEVCAGEDVVCPAGPDCFAPEICADEERVLTGDE